MTVVSLTAGATTQDSAVVTAQVASVSSVRLAIDVDEAISNPDFVGPETPTAQGMVRFQVTNLDADRRFFYQLETDDVLDGPVGQFRTHPLLGQGDSDVLIVAAGDAGRTPDAPGVAGSLVPSRISNNPVHTLIADTHDPLLFVHLGDECYYNLGSGETWPDENGDPIVLGHDLAAYRRQYEDTFLQPHQAYLARRVARVHTWDDHEFGPNDSDRTSPGRDNACTVYREWEPYYPLPAGSGANPIYQSFQIDRTLFVVLDVRADRDPNATPAGPSKTMLGTAQKAWLDDLLATTEAEALVVFSAVSWLGFGGDSWGGFQDERTELVAMLDEHGWLDRMIMVCADVHLLAIEDGSNNNHGGFPVFQFAPLDASPSAPMIHQNSHGYQTGGQSGQYGTLRIRDTGDSIAITGTGWLNGVVWNAITFTVQIGQEPEPEPPPPPPPGLPQVAVAHIRQRLTWLGVHATTGRVIAELPDIRGEVSRLVSAYTSAQLTMPLPTVGPGHIPIRLVEQATQPIHAAIVAVVNDLPTWMGWILARKGGTGAQLELACVTPEGYLTRRRVRDHDFVDADRALIAESLIGDAEAIAGVGEGLGFELDVQLTGDEIDREYLLTDRSTVYDDLRELATGIEFTVDLDWSDTTRTVVRKILRIRARIGRQVQPPEVVFEATGAAAFESQSGSDATYTLLEDHSDGRYANYVVAYAPGEGEDQPASVPAVDQAALDGGAPIVERHWQPSSSIIDTGVLGDHATKALVLMRRGAQVWQIDARLDAYPRPGVDVTIGDDVAWQLKGHRHPSGVTGRGRMMGYVIDHENGRWRPILLDPQEVHSG